jgi:hypothetical protein
VTSREILEEFAAHRQGVDAEYEVGVRIMDGTDFHGWGLEGFDIDDPQAMAAERERLERALNRRPKFSVRKRPSMACALIKRAPLRKPCEHCGAETPENTLGPIARFCSATCRFAAAYREKIASGKCRKARCESDAEEGKTYCRTHLDALAAADRQRRQQRSAETRKAA